MTATPPPEGGWPSVTVVIPTRERPELLRAALRAVEVQDYKGAVDAIVVYDGTQPEPELVDDLPGVSLTLLTNDRTPGLCGGRNTGILAASGELVAFCDDDDEWLPGKLTAQVRALLDEPGAEFSSTSITVVFDGTETVRLAQRDRVTYPELLRSRLAMLHSSTFVARRSALVHGIGLLDETIPGSMCEDWDLLLRAAARRPVVHVDQPLVRVRWGATSFFSRRWETKLAAHEWMFDNHPAIWSSRVGAGRLLGQMAFEEAALGRRGAAVRTAGRALVRNPREHRAVLAVAVASGVTSASKVLSVLHRYGRGI